MKYLVSQLESGFPRQAGAEGALVQVKKVFKTKQGADVIETEQEVERAGARWLQKG